MSNAFEDAMHQGYSAEEMAAEAAEAEACIVGPIRSGKEFISMHGCLDCGYYGPKGWLPGCLGQACDSTYKGGRN